MSEQSEIPISGPGVAPVRIKKIDAAIRLYEPAKDRRVAASREELDTKQKLTGLLHDYAGEIGKDGDGIVRYRFDGKIYSLEPEGEMLVIKKDDEAQE